jgi:hypothetical protein
MRSTVEIEDRPLPIFPCYPNKRPACANGFQDASADPERIAALWAGRTGLLVAVPTGEASGIAVLDIDRAGMAWLDANRQSLPETRTHQTRSGGRHLIFRHKPGLQCSRGLVAPGVDVRAEGGYVVWWPAHGFAVTDGDVLDWPEGLVPEPKQNNGIHAIPLKNGEPQPFVPNQSVEEIVRGFLCSNLASNPANVTPTRHSWVRRDIVFDKLRSTRRGTRGRTLNWAALVYGNMIAEGRLGLVAAERLLIDACKENGLWAFDGERAVRQEINRGLSFGIEQWRGLVKEAAE